MPDEKVDKTSAPPRRYLTGSTWDKILLNEADFEVFFFSFSTSTGLEARFVWLINRFNDRVNRRRTSLKSVLRERKQLKSSSLPYQGPS